MCRNSVTATEMPNWFCADATSPRHFGAGRAKARPHYTLLSETSSGHGLQPVRFFMRLGARIEHDILSLNF
jgi:hypothetical protein